MVQETMRKVLKFVGVPLILGMLILSMSPMMANAGNHSGGTGGGGGGGGGSNFRWVSLSTSNPWNTFVSQAGQGSSSRLERIVRATGANPAICKKSKTIWYVRSAGSGVWSHNYNSYTNGSRSNVAGSIQNPYSTAGGTPSNKLYRSFLRWDREKNGSALNGSPGYTVICSGAFEVKPDRKSSSRVVRSTTKATSSDSDTFKEPYSYTTSVTPRMNPDGELTAQTEAVKTNFGKEWDRWNGSRNSGVSSLRTRVNNAVSNDRNIEHAQVNLSDSNKKAFAKGGVLDVNEHTRYATIRATTKTTTTTTRRCHWTEEWNPDTDKYKARKYHSCVNSKSDTKDHSKSTTMGTPENTGYWQMLAVQCNVDGFDNLVNSDSSLTVDSRLNTADDTAGVVRTKKYNSKPSRTDFGESRHSNSAKAATGDMSFFTQDCGFLCTAEPDGDMNNGSDQNQNGNHVPEGSTTSGAVTGSGDDRVNSGVFKQFRDNHEKHYTLDVWYPVFEDDSPMSYDGQEAKSTRWIINKDGTPTSEATFKAGGTHLPHGEVTEVPGLSRILTAQSYWASDENEPHRISTIWNYDITAQTGVPNTIGFGRAGALVDQGRSTIDAEAEAVCYASYNGVNEPAGEESAGNSYNNLIRENTDSSEAGQYELELNFQRSVAEGNNTD